MTERTPPSSQISKTTRPPPPPPFWISMNKNIALLKETEQKIQNLSVKLITLRAGAGANLMSKVRKVIQGKEQELKESLTQLK